MAAMSCAPEGDDPTTADPGITALVDQYDAILSEMVDRARTALAQGWHPTRLFVALAAETVERLDVRGDENGAVPAILAAALVRLAQRDS